MLTGLKERFAIAEPVDPVTAVVQAAGAKMQGLIDLQTVKKRGVVKIAFIGIKDMLAGDKAQIPLFFRGGGREARKVKSELATAFHGTPSMVLSRQSVPQSGRG